MDDAKNEKFTSVEMRMDQYELDRYLEETTYHSGSTLPARFNDLQKGLLCSSGLTEKTIRYARMAKDMSESMMYNDQLKQSRYGRVSEVLLLIIAVLNASTIIYGLANKTYEVAAGAVFVLLVVVGIYVVWHK